MPGEGEDNGRLTNIYIIFCSNIERIIFKGKLGKFIWVTLQGFFYSIRQILKIYFIYTYIYILGILKLPSFISAVTI